MIHVASPFPAENPRDEMEVIGPAVDGTKNVLEACANTKGGVKRVVLTSSCAAIYGKKASESHMNLRQFTLRRRKLKRPMIRLLAGFHQRRSRSGSRKQKRKNQQITRPGIEFCDWFILPLLFPTHRQSSFHKIVRNGVLSRIGVLLPTPLV